METNEILNLINFISLREKLINLRSSCYSSLDYYENIEKELDDEQKKWYEGIKQKRDAYTLFIEKLDVLIMENIYSILK